MDLAPRHRILAALAAAAAAAGLAAAHYMDQRGHIVTGMNNQIVWGLPHVFAILLIVAASGVLNIASVASVFGEQAYKPAAPLAGLLSLALLAGGLMVLMLDLGRPDRVIVAATHFNPSSMFAWNVLLYSGMAAIVVFYLWTMFERSRLGGAAGVAVLVWRIALTSGTGLIFAFVVARPGYGSALLPLLFVAFSFAWGLAAYLVAQALLGARPGAALQRRMARLLGVFVAAAFYLVVVQHLVGLYFARASAFEAFVLRDGGVYPLLLWGGYAALGTLLPLALLLAPGGPRAPLAAAAAVLAGAFAWLYAFIVGGQAYPLEIFPGYAASSSFADGAVARYAPRWPEWMLGLGGVGAALLIAAVGVRMFDFLPRAVDDEAGR